MTETTTFPQETRTNWVPLADTTKWDAWNDLSCHKTLRCPTHGVRFTSKNPWCRNIFASDLDDCGCDFRTFEVDTYSYDGRFL